MVKSTQGVIKEGVRGEEFTGDGDYKVQGGASMGLVKASGEIVERFSSREADCGRGFRVGGNLLGAGARSLKNLRINVEDVAPGIHPVVLQN